MSTSNISLLIICNPEFSTSVVQYADDECPWNHDCLSRSLMVLVKVVFFLLSSVRIVC